MWRYSGRPQFPTRYPLTTEAVWKRLNHVGFCKWFVGAGMKRFIEGEDRRQALLLPDCLEDYVSDDNPVRVIEAFIDELDLKALGFEGVVSEAQGRPGYHPAA